MIDLAAELIKALQDPSVAAVLARQLAPALAPAVAELVEKNSTDGLMQAEETAARLGYKHTDGTPNLIAFKEFRKRHPEFCAIGTKIGRRWFWRRSVFERWLDDNPKTARKVAARGA